MADPRLAELEDTIVSLVFKSDFFYARFLQQMTRFADERIPTMAVSISNTLNLHINPNFLAGLTQDQRVAVLKHELLHVINGHLTRRGKKNPYLSNIAEDLAINQFIPNLPLEFAQCQKCFLTFQANAVPDKCPNCKTAEYIGPCQACDVDNFKIGNKKLNLPKKEAAETYYDILEKNMPPKMQMKGLKLTSEQAEKLRKILQDAGIASQGSGQPEPGENDSGNDGGSGEISDSEFDKLAKELADALKDGLPRALDNHEAWGMGDNTNDLNQEIIKGVVKNTLEQVKRERGKIPQEFEGLLEKLLRQNTLSWRTLLRRFAGTSRVAGRQPTRKLPDRRFGSIFPGQKIKFKGRIAVAVDSSGSVTDKELQMFFSEIDRVYDSGVAVTIICCDCDIWDVYEYDSAKRKSKNIKFKSRGGTSFKPPFVLVANRKYSGHNGLEFKLKGAKIDGMIYFTDLEGDFPDKMPVPTLWIGVPRSSSWGLDEAKRRKLNVTIMKDEI